MSVPLYRWVVLNTTAYLDIVTECDGTPGTVITKWFPEEPEVLNAPVQMLVSSPVARVLRRFYHSRRTHNRYVGEGVHEFNVHPSVAAIRSTLGIDYMTTCVKLPSLWLLLHNLCNARVRMHELHGARMPSYYFGRNFGMGNVREHNAEDLKMATAERRARATARRVLIAHRGKTNGEKAYKKYLGYGYVPLRAASGKMYLITGGHGMVDVYEKNKLVDRLCLLLKGGFCDTDQFLMRYLKLGDGKDGEEWYHKYANHQLGMGIVYDDEPLAVVEKAAPKKIDMRPLTEIAQDARRLFVSPLWSVTEAIAEAQIERLKVIEQLAKQRLEAEDAQREADLHAQNAVDPIAVRAEEIAAADVPPQLNPFRVAYVEATPSPIPR